MRTLIKLVLWFAFESARDRFNEYRRFGNAPIPKHSREEIVELKNDDELIVIALRHRDPVCAALAATVIGDPRKRRALALDDTAQPYVRTAAMHGLPFEETLYLIAASSPDVSICLAAASELRLDDSLRKLARISPHVSIRRFVANRLTDREALREIVCKDPDETVRETAHSRFYEIHGHSDRPVYA